MSSQTRAGASMNIFHAFTIWTFSTAWSSRAICTSLSPTGGYTNISGLKADECLFIDDREENVRGAEKVGINAVRFENNYGEIAKKYGL